MSLLIRFGVSIAKDLLVKFDDVIHLDHHNCFEIVIAGGEKMKVEKLATLIKAAKGVRHSSLRLTAAIDSG